MKRFKNNASNEYRATSLAFYSFICMQALFFIFRLIGLDMFIANYNETNIQINYYLYVIIMFLFYWFEGYFISKILLNITNKKIIIISFIYAVASRFIPASILLYVELSYIFILPLIINSDGIYKSLGRSIIYFCLISLYILFMSFGRYDFKLFINNDINILILSFIEYKLFILNFYLFLKLRRVNNMNNSGCWLWWGKYDKFAEILGKVFIGIVTIGIVPLVVHIRGKKCKKEESTK